MTVVDQPRHVRDEDRIDGVRLDAFLRERIAGLSGDFGGYYQFLLQLERLPLTPSGKVDRRNLPDPKYFGTEDEADEPVLAPVEEIVAGIWIEVLKKASLSRNANFFEVGGHSLLATKVVSRLRQVFGVELPLRAMFEAPTVEGLARRVAIAVMSASSIE